ncbi:transglutaminase-like cysteine peptidase [Rhizobium sp. RAF56]|jgi:predicted transglutaminase-like cysteine proteinase|uniref:transglutaminase-like cysteine peptidase n=1 Tax=Rhizobium sp. RAF56 TaxID=3233062 RepID=UPI003F9779E6
MTTRCWLRSAATAAALTFGLFGLANATPAKMTILGNAAPPIGHYEFCRDNPAECSDPNGDVGPLALTEDLWKQILKVNYTVNTTITPITDKELYGVEEKWAIPTRAGDCEDFALLKRKQLIEAGISPSDLLMTVVLQQNGEGHALLTVRTDRGDFVLDNMRNKVLLWTDTEYTFLKRQSSEDPVRWVKIQDGRAVAVGSVK